MVNASRTISVLIVEDSPLDVELMLSELRRANLGAIRHKTVADPDALQRALEEEHWDIVLSDFNMPRFDAFDAIERVHRAKRDIPFIIVTGSLDEETAVESLKRGADNYILKENLKRLGPAVDQALRMFAEKTRRRQLEQLLIRSQKKEVVGQFASGIAHDISNVMLVIRGWLDLVEHGKAEHNEALRGIRSAVDQGLGTTRSLLTFSRETNADQEEVDLRQVMQTGIDMVRQLIPAKIELVTVFPEDPFYVLGNESQLRQVLINLVVNARDAMPQGGRIEVRLSQRDGGPVVGIPGKAVERQDDRLAVLSIRDEGVGMSSLTLSRAFDPYFTTKPKEEGTGLGLAIVENLIDQHGGTIQIESKPGIGTRIEVALPLIGEGQDPPLPPEDLPQARAGLAPQRDVLGRR